MALSYAHGSFTWAVAATDPVNTVKTCSCGFTPKAIRVWTTGFTSTSPTNATSDTAHNAASLGFATGPSARRMICVADRDAQGNAVTGVASSDVAVLGLADGSSASLIGALDVDSFNATDFKLIVDTANALGAAVTVFWEAWGGADIADCCVGTITEPAATGNQDYATTGAGAFVPDVVLFAGTNTTSIASVSNVNLGLCFGATDGTHQFVLAAYSDDGAATMATARYHISSECLAAFTTTGNGAINPNARASFVQWNTGTPGFRLNWLARATTDRCNIYLAIKGGRWDVGSQTINVGTVGNTATVTESWQPNGVLLFTQGAAERTAGSGASTAICALGRFISTTDRSAMGVLDETGTANAEIDQAIYYDQCLVVPNVSASPPGLLQGFDVNSVSSSGFQLIIDTAQSGGSTVLFSFIAFADAPAAMTISASDAVSATDVPDAVVHLGSRPFDAITTTDVRRAGLNLGVRPAESVTAGEATTDALNPLLRLIAEVISLLETARVGLNLATKPFDAVTALDEATASLLLARLKVDASETLAVAESAKAVLDPLAAKVSEILTVLDSATPQLTGQTGLSRLVFEALTLAEQAKAVVTPSTVARFETVTATEFTKAVLTPTVKAVAETITALDRVTAALQLGTRRAEAITALDVATPLLREARLKVLAADPVALADAATRLLTPLIVRVNEAIAVAEAFQGGMGLFPVVSDAVHVTDAPLPSLALVRLKTAVTETLTVAELTKAILTPLTSTRVESLTVTELVKAVASPLTARVSETLLLSEAAAGRFSKVTASLADAVALLDAATVTLLRIRLAGQVAESLTVTEAVVVLGALPMPPIFVSTTQRLTPLREAVALTPIRTVSSLVLPRDSEAV